MANKENLPPRLGRPPVSIISPSNKPALGRQRDHSACRAATPLKVQKTRENLKQASACPEIPPPCLHAPNTHHDHRLCPASDQATAPRSTNANLAHPELAEVTLSRNLPFLPEQQPSQPSLNVQSKVQRQQSVSRRMLSRVKQGIASKSKSSLIIRPTGSETGLARRLSGRRKASLDEGCRSQSLELSRDSIENTIDEVSGVSTGTPPPVQRSFTDSTVSTSEILEDLASVQVPSFRASYGGAATEANLSTIQSSPSPATASPSPQPTPRPFRKSIAPVAAVLNDGMTVAIPGVNLKINVDTTSVDVSSKRDAWVAIVATVQFETTSLTASPTFSSVRGHLFADRANLPASTTRGANGDEATHEARHNCGVITSLRLCYKPADGCRVRNIIGQNSYKDLAIGQQCMLFIKMGVPRLQPTADHVEPHQESLLAELESMVGTLETDILHVEVRYRHSMLPADNVVALKQSCKLLRPNTESRWSLIGLYENEDGSSNVHARLAQYLADHYAADEALELLHRYFDLDTRRRPGMAEVCLTLQNKIDSRRSGFDDQKPEVVVTDIDLKADNASGPTTEHYATAPSTPSEAKIPNYATAVAHKRMGSSSSLVSSTLAPALVSASRTTTAITTASFASSPPGGEAGHESHDSARQLWRHIRRTSLSARQLEEVTPERLSNLEAGDDSLRDLRRRALANKRSIGAETLRAWKWEEDMQTKERPAEAPWM